MLEDANLLYCVSIFNICFILLPLFDIIHPIPSLIIFVHIHIRLLCLAADAGHINTDYMK